MRNTTIAIYLGVDFLDRKNYKHNNLPHGKDLTSSSLLRALEKIFLGKESNNPRKLATYQVRQRMKI
jgi:hypothetical protein